jgi:hypothetical protein
VVVGGVRNEGQPVTVTQIHRHGDLALLRLDRDTTAQYLPLAAHEPRAGTHPVGYGCCRTGPTCPMPENPIPTPRRMRTANQEPSCGNRRSGTPCSSDTNPRTSPRPDGGLRRITGGRAHVIRHTEKRLLRSPIVKVKGQNSSLGPGWNPVFGVRIGPEPGLAAAPVRLSPGSDGRRPGSAGPATAVEGAASILWWNRSWTHPARPNGG